jgi:hypothetical protein
VPFSPANLNALLQTSAFNLWHYRTADTRAVVSAAGYFTPVAASLKAGDLMILQTVDAMALVPFRSNAVPGTGVTLDGAVGPIALLRTASQGFRFGQAASAVVRTILLAPIAATPVTPRQSSCSPPSVPLTTASRGLMQAPMII